MKKTNESDFLGILIIVLTFIITYFIILSFYEDKVNHARTAGLAAKVIALGVSLFGYSIYKIIKKVIYRPKVK